jgi:hypothetical protein
MLANFSQFAHLPVSAGMNVLNCSGDIGLRTPRPLSAVNVHRR